MQRGAANTLRANAMQMYPSTLRRLSPSARKRVEKQITPKPKTLNRSRSFTVRICIMCIFICWKLINFVKELLIYV